MQRGWLSGWRYMGQNVRAKPTSLRPRRIITNPAHLRGGNQEIKEVVMDENKQRRIRKLTPLECWRLMGFDDEDFRKAEAVNSNSQLYKQAGNSIVVNVLEGILRNLLLPAEPETALEVATVNKQIGGKENNK